LAAIPYILAAVTIIILYKKFYSKKKLN